MPTATSVTQGKGQSYAIDSLQRQASEVTILQQDRALTLENEYVAEAQVRQRAELTFLDAAAEKEEGAIGQHPIPGSEAYGLGADADAMAGRLAPQEDEADDDRYPPAGHHRPPHS